VITLRTHRTLFAVALAIFAGLFAAAPAQGDDVSVEVQAPDTAFLGDSIPFAIVVNNSRDVEAPDLSGLADFTAVYTGPQDSSSSFTQIINGRVTTQSTVRYALTYRLKPKRTGTLTIPPITVAVAGKTYTTRSLTITVREPHKTTDHRIDAELESVAAFVGQPVRVTYTWVIGQDFRGYALSGPLTTPAYEVLPGPDPRPPNLRPDQQQNQYARFEIAGGQVIATRGRTEIAGRAADAWVFDLIVIPRAPGTINLPALRIDLDAVVGQRQRNMFDSMFADPAIVERRFVQGPALAITVEPLPIEGRPADFSGLVGSYTLRASAAPQDAAVGDPIRLQVVVAGPAPTSLIPPLDFTRQPGFGSAWRVPRSPILPELSPTEATFSLDVRARSDQIVELPAIQLSYFDPKSRRYSVARSKPIPLSIRPSTQVSLGDEDPPETPSADAAASEDEATPAAETRVGGLAPIDRRPPRQPSVSPTLAQVLTHPAAITTVGVSAAGLAAAFMFALAARRRDAAPLSARSRRAVDEARRTLRRAGDDPARVSVALRTCLAACFERDAGTLTAVEAADLLAEQPAEQPAERRRLAGVLAECDAAVFGSTPAAPGLGSRALAALDDLAPLARRNAA
jgi:hypothetical protein